MLESLSKLLAVPGVLIGVLALASYLTIFWTLRGSPAGQSPAAKDDPDAPPPGRRDRIIAGISAGLTLILVGSYLAFAQGILWSIPVLAVGVGLALYLNVTIQPYRHSSPILRRTSVLSSLFLNASLLAGILIVANVAAFRYGGWGIDLTREQTFSLASRTINQLESLDRPLTFHLLFGRGPRSVRQLERVAQLLELYAAARPGQIKIDSFNPFAELARSEDLAKRAPDLAVIQGDRVLIEYGEGTDAQFVVVPGSEMFEPVAPDVSRRGPDRFESVFKGEDAITSALIRLREGKKSKIAFTTGHGEPGTADLNPADPGSVCGEPDLPRSVANPWTSTCSRILSPTTSPSCASSGPGIRSSPRRSPSSRSTPTVADRSSSWSATPSLPAWTTSSSRSTWRSAAASSSTPGSTSMAMSSSSTRSSREARDTRSPTPCSRSGPCSSPTVRRFRFLDSALTRPVRRPNPVNANLVPTIILRSGPQSWVETDLANRRPRFDQGVDKQGPVPVGVAVQERAAPAGASPKPRLVLFSSSTLATNIVQELEPTNLDLVMNAASWLRGRPEAVGIAASTHVALTLTADPLLRNRLVLVPTVMVTLAIIAAGLIVYVARRE